MKVARYRKSWMLYPAMFFVPGKRKYATVWRPLIDTYSLHGNCMISFYRAQKNVDTKLMSTEIRLIWDSKFVCSVLFDDAHDQHGLDKVTSIAMSFGQSSSYKPPRPTITIWELYAFIGCPRSHVTFTDIASYSFHHLYGCDCTIYGFASWLWFLSCKEFVLPRNMEIRSIIRWRRSSITIRKLFCRCCKACWNMKQIPHRVRELC